MVKILLPLIGELVARADGLHAVLDPLVGVALPAIVVNGHLERQLGVDHLVYALLANLGKPLLQRFGPFGRNGLYDTENALQRGGLGHAVFSVGSFHPNRGTNCPPLQLQLGVALEHLLDVVAGVHGFRQNLHNVGNGEVVLLPLLVSNNAHFDALNYLNNSLVTHNTPWG